MVETAMVVGSTRLVEEAEAALNINTLLLPLGNTWIEPIQSFPAQKRHYKILQTAIQPTVSPYFACLLPGLFGIISPATVTFDPTVLASLTFEHE